MIKFIMYAADGGETRYWTNWMIFAKNGDEWWIFSVLRLFLRLICTSYKIYPRIRYWQIIVKECTRVIHTESTFAQIFVIYKSGYDLLFLSDFLSYSIAGISVKLWIASRCDPIYSCDRGPIEWIRCLSFDNAAGLNYLATYKYYNLCTSTVGQSLGVWSRPNVVSNLTFSMVTMKTTEVSNLRYSLKIYKRIIID
jgi:hypothetical protein